VTRNRFVVPSEVRLELTEGDWVLVKERLDFGETQALTAATLAQSGNLAGGETPTLRLDLAGYKLERLSAYLLDWSFTDLGGNPVLVTRATIAALDPATADEIDAALDRHLEALGANPTVPTPTSTSP
jgi:hypothetical protein